MPDVPSGNRNYLRGTSDEYQTYTNSNYILGYPSTYRDWSKLLEPLRDKTVTIRAYIKNDTDYPVRIQIWFTRGGIYGNTIAPHSEGWSVKTGKMSADWTSANVALTQEPSTASGGTIQVKEAKVEISETATPYSQAPEDLGWSTATLVPTQQQRYLWKFEYVYYSDGSVEVTDPVNLSIAGADANTTGVTDAINQTNQTVAGLQNSVSQAQSDLATVSSNLTQARQDLEESVASVNAKTQAVETTLAQVQSTTNANSQKTATLENDLDGLSAKFSSLKIGAVNLLKDTKSFKSSLIGGSSTLTGETYQGCAVRYFKNTNSNSNYQNVLFFLDEIFPKLESEYVLSFWAKGSGTITPHFNGASGYLKCASAVSSQGASNSHPDGSTTVNLADDWQRFWVKYKLASSPVEATQVSKRVTFLHVSNSTEDEVYLAGVQLEEGNVATDYSSNEADLELKVADYKQTADQNYASLQTTVQNLDGTVTANKATADQTAQGFSTRIESLETYKDGETTRANQYFESAKTETARQLTAERTAIANDYVAKSTYTSDVTGLRNDLTATTTTANTTKTNLASYQASNDRAVASLQSSLQTTDGNVSNLQTQINAVPGQITSAVSAVEGKIPTEAGGRNLIIKSQIQNGYIDNTGNLASSNSQFTTGFIDATDNKQFTITAPKFDNGFSCFRLIKYDADKNFLGRDIISYTQDAKTVKVINLADNVACFKVSFDGVYREPFKIERGSLATDWSPAPEDAIEEISSLSSQIQQTADGMTLLATKTELNSAKTELQSGITTATSKANSAQATANSNAQTISTHTAQISALNTGLQAKVSQSDFDSLSGDVDDLSSELTQTASSITASVSSVETKADNAQTTANSAVSKANAAQTAVNTLDSEVVKSASLNLDNNGFVTKVGKTVDGNKFATMIAQDANNVKIIADEMQVTANMIVDGAVTANKLNVNNLSAVNSNLGAIEGGSLLLQENKTASSSVDSWGTFNRPAHKQGLYMDNHGLASSGPIQRKNGSETTPTDMPLAVLQSGELRFLVVDYNDNLENVLHYGLSDPDYGAIRFEIDSELKRRLTMTSSGYLNFQATNYTNWQSTGVSGCEYMIQGRLVLVNYDVTFSSAGTHTIGGIPQKFTKKSLMMTAKAWTITPRDKNIQLNSDGSLHILDAEANVNYRGTLVFSY